MAHRLPDGNGFADHGDPAQPRVVITIDGGLALSDRERVLRDYMVKDFVDALVTAIRGYYDFRKLSGPPKQPIDAGKVAAETVTTEVPM